MLKPGLNIIVGVHPLGFKGLIACMLDVGFADDMGGMPDIEGMFIVDDDSDAILDMESTEVIEFTDSGVLLADMETGQGWAIDIVGVEDSGFAVATTLLLAIESIVGSFIDILGINSSGLSDLRIIVLPKSRSSDYSCTYLAPGWPLTCLDRSSTSLASQQSTT